MARALALSAVCLAVLAAGCGSGGKSGDPGLGVVIGAVPGDRQVSAVDAVEVRRQLGLPADAGVRRDKRLDAGRLTLLQTLGTTLPFLAESRGDALVDVGAVQEAAVGGLTPDQRVIAVRSSKAAADVLEALTTKGWKHDGDVFSRASGTPRFAGQGKREVVLFAQTRAALDQARRGAAPGGAARSLIESFDQPVRTAATFGTGATCLRAYAAGEDLDPARGRLVAVSRGTPRGDRLGNGIKTDETTVTSSKIEGGRVVARFTGATRLTRGLVGTRFLQNLRFDLLYRCS